MLAAHIVSLMQVHLLCKTCKIREVAWETIRIRVHASPFNQAEQMTTKSW